MFGRDARRARQLEGARKLIGQLAGQLDVPLSIRLWDGSKVPLGRDADPNRYLSISGPGVVGSLLRRPTPENLLRQYACGNIDFHGADLYTLLEALSVRDSRKRARKVRASSLVSCLLPFLFEPAATTSETDAYQGDVTGRSRHRGDNRDFIQFHYDVSNEFYQLFLDKEMVYSCGYFTDWSHSLDQAQADKMDMICRKLQLQRGDRFLDIGSGWGGLLCHAAQNYGVRAHGITLAENQFQYTQEKVRRLGLQEQVTVEICDYADFEGEFDKIASVGMVEHVGIDHVAGFIHKVRSLMPAHGIFLLHGITRPGKASLKQFRRMNVERRLLNKYVFPGGELDHLGHLIQCMEAGGFEVADVEGWRNHYIHTCRLWCQNLYARRDEAIQHVGQEKYRMWLLYLAGCSLAFKHGGARLYQVLGEKHVKREASVMPPTRAHLYHDRHDTPSAQRQVA